MKDTESKLVVDLDKKLKKRFKTKCVNKDLKIKEVITSLIIKFLED